MRKSRTYGSVRGAPGNRRSYRDHRPFAKRIRAVVPCQWLTPYALTYALTGGWQDRSNHENREAPLLLIIEQALYSLCPLPELYPLIQQVLKRFRKSITIETL